MFKYLAKKNAQTTLEYAVLIGVLVAGLIGMQIYIKRGYQGKLRESSDNMGQQFSPGLTTNEYTTTSSTGSKETVIAGESKTVINSQVSDKTGTESVKKMEDDSL